MLIRSFLIRIFQGLSMVYSLDFQICKGVCTLLLPLLEYSMVIYDSFVDLYHGQDLHPLVIYRYADIAMISNLSSSISKSFLWY